VSPKVSLRTSKVTQALAVSVQTNIEDWRSGDSVRRPWKHDAAL
jgi:hypothetical protein